MKKLLAFVILLILLPLSAAIAEPNCVTKDGHLAAISMPAYREMLGYVVQDDRVALRKLISANRVFIINGGVSVYLEDKKVIMFQGKALVSAKIRLPGSTTPLWTSTKAINCK